MKMFKNLSIIAIAVLLTFRLSFAEELVIEVGDEHVIQFLLIEAGLSNFTSYDEQTNAKRFDQIEVEEFYMSKYEVSVELFHVFIEEGGYDNRQFWSEGWDWRISNSIQSPLHWDLQLASDGRFPVTGVSYYEALAFCEWLSKKSGEKVAIPSVMQWEYAAEGKASNFESIFSWNESLNEKNVSTLDAQDINSGFYGSNCSDDPRKFPSGTFKKDVSAFGVYDLGGSVGEIVEPFESYHSKMAVKGGSYMSGRRLKRLSKDIKKFREYFVLMFATNGQFSPAKIYQSTSTGLRLVVTNEE